MNFVDEGRNIEWFLQDASDAELGESGIKFVMECNDDDHGGASSRKHFGERSNDPDPIEPGHHQIDHQRVDVLSFEQFEGFDAVACEQNIEIGQEQEIARGATDFRVIVDDEDGPPARMVAGKIPLLVVHSRGYEAVGDERKGETP